MITDLILLIILNATTKLNYRVVDDSIFYFNMHVE